MGRFLRKTSKGLWSERGADGGVTADALGDLKTKENKLSVYEIDDEAQIERVAVALAASRDFVANFDYALLDNDFLDSLAIKFVVEAGTTADDLVNQMHRDLVFESGVRLVEFAQKFLTCGQTRIPEKKIKKWLESALSVGGLDAARINQKLKSKILPHDAPLIPTPSRQPAFPILDPRSDPPGSLPARPTEMSQAKIRRSFCGFGQFVLCGIGCLCVSIGLVSSQAAIGNMCASVCLVYGMLLRPRRH